MDHFIFEGEGLGNFVLLRFFFFHLWALQKFLFLAPSSCARFFFIGFQSSCLLKYHQKWAFHEVCLYKYRTENDTCTSSTAFSPRWYQLHLASLFSVTCWVTKINEKVRLIEGPAYERSVLEENIRHFFQDRTKWPLNRQWIEDVSWTESLPNGVSLHDNLKNPIAPFRNTVEPREYGRHLWANDLAVLTGDRINERFFHKKIYGRFAGRPKQVAVITRWRVLPRRKWP